MSRAFVFVIVVMVGVLAGCADAEPADPAPGEPSVNDSAEPTSPLRTVPPRLDREIASGLNVPWAIAFLRDGSALVSQRDTASIVRVDPDGGVRELGTVPEVEPGGEGGLQGLALTADESTLFAYVTTRTDNRVIRMSLDDDGLGTAEPILTGLAKAQHHQGGALLYDERDDVLFVAVGDASQPATAQDPAALNGKILRITRDGDPAADNPFGNAVWSLGHRNVEGLAFDGHGRLLASEFGDKSADELNLIERGGNYGWPEVEGDSDDRRFVAPAATWAPAEASPAGLAIVGDTAYLGALRGQRLWAVTLDGETASDPRPAFVEEFGRIRAVAGAGEDSLWISTSNTDGRIAARPGDDRLLKVTVRESS